MKKRTVSKRSTRTPRTRGNGKYTESQFWNLIRIALREKSRYWPPIAECRKKARRYVTTFSGKKKAFYQCNGCKKLFNITEIEVDHIVPVGALSCSNDLPGFVDRLFVEANMLQVLCNTCHNLKTEKERICT